MRQQEHAGAGKLAADDLRRPQTVVDLARGHADVDDRDVGLVGARLAKQVIRVGCLRHDVESGVLQQPRDALAHEDRIIGDHDAQHASILIVSRCAGASAAGAVISA